MTERLSLQHCEIRQVPEDWVHPRISDENSEGGRYRPLRSHYQAAVDQYREDCYQWDQLQKARVGNLYASIPTGMEALTAAEYYGPAPVADDFMPEWLMEQKTHVQLYDRRRGIPVSPVFKDNTELLKWFFSQGIQR